MNLKLTKKEFKALFILFRDCIAEAKPKGMSTIVLHSVLFGFYKKMYAKAIIDRKRYTITLSDGEACAFWLLFNNYPLPAEDVFTVNLITQINFSIHQKFSA